MPGDVVQMNPRNRLTREEIIHPDCTRVNASNDLPCTSVISLKGIQPQTSALNPSRYRGPSFPWIWVVLFPWTKSARIIARSSQVGVATITTCPTPSLVKMNWRIPSSKAEEMSMGTVKVLFFVKLWMSTTCKVRHRYPVQLGLKLCSRIPVGLLPVSF